MKGCRRVHSMMAASLYEALPPDEARTMDQHLGGCSACREELEGLRRLVADLPGDVPVFQGDLRPVLRERRRELKRPGFRMAWLASAMVFVAAALVLSIAWVPGMIPTDDRPDVSVEATSPVARALDRAETLITDDDNLLAARDMLETALESAPEDDQAGNAWLMMARVQYGLGHYDASLSAYETVRADHPDAWRSGSTEAKLHYDLLAETRDEGFAPLVDLERARRKGDSAFGELERMVARRPESVVAREALAAMCATVGQDDAASRVAILEGVRRRCTDATALARVDLEMGHAYWRDLDDPQRARSHFAVAAEAENAVLARLATDALRALEAPAP